MLGLLLVVVSTAGVAGLVAAADRTERAFAVRHVVAAGDELTPRDLRVVQVRLGAARGAYLDSVPRPGTVVTRTLARGELVPVGALAAASSGERTSVMIEAERSLPGAVTVGADVDVWAADPSAERSAERRFDAPRVLVPEATVVRIDRGSALGASSGMSVEVRVPKSAAAALLAAIANGAAVTLLPAGG